MIDARTITMSSSSRLGPRRSAMILYSRLRGNDNVVDA